MDPRNDINKCIETLESGGLILYPTDTIWGIGCDATNGNAVEKIFRLKKRADNKAMIILVADAEDIFKYVEHPDKKISEYLSSAEKPTTAIYQNAKGLAENLVQADGSIAIRIVNDDFCKMLIREFGKPIVSTSANISGSSFPQNFREISEEIKSGVDYIVQHRRDDLFTSAPSSIIKMENGNIIKIR